MERNKSSGHPAPAISSATWPCSWGPPRRLINSQSQYGKTLCERFHLAGRDLPALITANGMPLRRPSLREVARVAGLLRDPAREDESEVKCDLVIIGAGPAGLAAAVYAGSEGLKTIVLES